MSQKIKIQDAWMNFIIYNYLMAIFLINENTKQNGYFL